MEFESTSSTTNLLLNMNRIRCNGSRIQVGDRDFTSASEALEAYLDQYVGITSSHRQRNQYRQSVSDLLDPKSSLHLTADRALETGVRDTVTEMKLAEARDSINDSYDKMRRSMALRAEGKSSLQSVDEALDKSGELLQRIAYKEPLPDTHSELSSLNTDILLSVNPSGLGGERKRGHVYSYKKPRNASKLVNNVSSYKPPSDGQLLEGAPKNVPPSSYRGSVPRERSRSVSPSSFRHEERLMSNPARRGMESVLNNSRTKAPSWVEALDITTPKDTLWSKRDFVSGRPAPSWVNGLDQSDIASLNSDIPHKRVEFANSSLNRTTDSNPPGLSVNDLLSKSPAKSSLKSPKSLRKYDLSLSSKLPKEVKEAGNVSTNSSDILDKYLENSVKGDDIYDVSRPPRCSSLDTEALIAGIAAPNKSDITGASPIVPSDKSSSRQSRSRCRPQSPDTDMVLEGDRSWEKPLPSFKSPVNLLDSNDSKPDTLTGTPQPGSLEALKNMLFKLQTEAASHTTTESKPLSKDDILRNDFGKSNATKLEEDIPALKGYNWQEEPGGQSLEKALVHLGRLKTLVNEDKERILRSRSPSPAASLRSKSYSPTRSAPMYN